MSTTVNARFKNKRGSESSIPTLLEGELYLCTDTNKIYKGTGSGNVCIGDYEKLLQLIEDMNGKQNKINDSGWIDLSETINSNVTGTLYVRKIDNEVHCYLKFVGALSENDTICTLPDLYKPKRLFYQYGRFVGGIATICFDIDGSVKLDKVNTSALGSSTTCITYTSYLTN